MSVIDQALKSNEQYAKAYDPRLGAALPRPAIAVVTCIDGVKREDFDTLLYPGGHGPMWDLAEDSHSIKLIESFLAAGKPIGIVRHSTGALHRVETPDGKPLVQGKEVTGFTNGEEEEMGLTKVVPFLVEDES